MFITFLEREQGPARRVWQWEGGARRKEMQSPSLSQCAHKECSEGTELRLHSHYQECSVFWGVQAIRVKNVGTMRN